MRKSFSLPRSIERVYLDDPRIKPQTIAHHKARYVFAVGVRRPAGTALDLACGSGYGAEMIRRAGYKALGIDKSPEAISYAKTHYPLCQFEVANVLEMRCGLFDLITFFEAIEHLTYTDGELVIRKVSRALNPGGAFVLSTPRLVNPIYKQFHKSQWGYQSLKKILGQNFPHMEILGQDWDTAIISRAEVEQNDFYIGVCRV